MAGDWIKLHRKLLDSPVMQHAGLLHLWCYCLLRANWQDRTVLIPGTTEQRTLKRGQFITGRRALHAALYPSHDYDGRKIRRDHPAPSDSTVWRWLQSLAKSGQLRLESEQHFTVVTVVKYSIYQSDDTASEPPSEPTVNQPCTNLEPTVNQPCTQSKKERNKESKEGKKLPDSSEPPLATSEQPVMEFPTVGKSKTWGLLPSFVATLSEAFPKLDIESECRKARGWCIANEAKRKTPGGMERFLFSWMERNQNRGRASPAAVDGRVLTRNGAEIFSERELFDESQ